MSAQDITANKKPFVAQQANTDFEVRSQNAMCVNSSELDKPFCQTSNMVLQEYYSESYS